MIAMVDIPAHENAHEKKHTEYEQHAQSTQQRHAALTEAQQALRARDVARLIGLSEAQWIAANCGPIKSVRLKVSARELINELGKLGNVMALTRNDSCVHERHGTYLNVQTEGQVGLVLGPEIDLRIFFGCWSDVFAVEEGGRLSLQFFDTAGGAVHKIYCTDKTDVSHYFSLVQRFADAHEWPQSTPINRRKSPDSIVDPALFLQSWLSMKDTHDFFELLQKFNVSRIAALQQAGPGLAQSVPLSSIEKILRQVAIAQIEVMCFVGNRGLIQIHTGQIHHVMMRGQWLNVLDPDFNLHLDMSSIKQVWVVNKPTVDGWVTSLEVYDASDELVVQFFGARKPGKRELRSWRSLMLSVCPQPLLS